MVDADAESVRTLLLAALQHVLVEKLNQLATSGVPCSHSTPA
jgi:hypothetical protein